MGGMSRVAQARNGPQPHSPRAVGEHVLAFLGRGPDPRPLGALSWRPGIYRRRGPDGGPSWGRGRGGWRRARGGPAARHATRLGLRLVAAAAVPASVALAS